MPADYMHEDAARAWAAFGLSCHWGKDDCWALMPRPAIRHTSISDHHTHIIQRAHYAALAKLEDIVNLRQSCLLLSSYCLRSCSCLRHWVPRQ